MKNRWRGTLCLLLALALCLGLSGCSAFQMQMAKTANRMSKLKSFQTDVEAYVGTLFDVGGQKIRMEGAVTGGLDVDCDPPVVRTDLVLETLGVERAMRFDVWRENGEWRFAPWGEGPALPSAESGARASEEEKSGWTEVLNLLVRCQEYFADPVENTVNGVLTKRYDGVIPAALLDEALGLLELSPRPDAPAVPEDAPGDADADANAAEIIPDDSAPADSEAAEAAEAPPTETGDALRGLPVSIWIDPEDRIVQVDADLTLFLRDVADRGIERLLTEYGAADLDLSQELQFADTRLTFSRFDEGGR